MFTFSYTWYSFKFMLLHLDCSLNWDNRVYLKIHDEGAHGTDGILRLYDCYVYKRVTRSDSNSIILK